MSVLLSIKDLRVQFKTMEGIVHAVNGVNLDVNEHEILGIVGESGSGKSVSMMATLGLIPTPPGEIVSGEAIFKGEDLLQYSEKQLKKIRGSNIGFIFQDPMTSFNPVLTIGRQLIEPLEAHRDMGQKEAYEKAEDMLNLVGIPNPKNRLNDFPHQFSGGMRQRAMIAMALICGPKLLIADEPTTALDVTIQAQIVELVIRLKEEMNMEVVWITHDLGVIARIADRCAVMYGGNIVEEADIEELYTNPMHPYTRGLLDSLPKKGVNRLKPIFGTPPVLMEKPHFCPFRPRCSRKTDICDNEPVETIELSNKHKVRCVLYK